MKNLLKKIQQNKPLLILLSCIHAVIMIAAILWYSTLPFTLGDEVTLIETSALIRNTLVKMDEKPDRDRFLFVNCAWEKQLIAHTDSNGFVIGNIDITNRKSLGRLVQVMNQKPDNHEFLLIDVRFYLESPDDSLLHAELPRLKNGILSYHKGANDKPLYPIFKAPLGLSDMESQTRSNQDDLMLKYHLVQGDSLKTTPLLMYEKMHDETLQKGMFFDQLSGHFIHNSFIIEHPIRKYDLFQAPDSLRYSYMHLGELVNLPDFVIQEFTKDRIVVVGDFEDMDIHRTIYGKLPGPLILVNAFLSLENGDNILSMGFLLFLFVTFAIISFKALTLRDPVTVFLEKRFSSDHFWLELARDQMFYLVYFAIVSLLSYVFFNTQLTILVLSFYVYGVEQGVISLMEEKEQKDKKDATEEADNEEKKIVNAKLMEQ
ncbi:hypothetical protein V6R21_23160 [Limibacter armeniacum]|uniref:hypothetical protein n=1 Tax=Limibacter armeniacum TaxID=466084 RepID=UPI002FE5EA55